MKKGSFFILSILIFVFDGYSQVKYDYNWMNGAEGTDTVDHGLVLTSFDNSIVEIKKIPYTGFHTNMYQSHTTMSDAAGNLIFYTNGCDIFNANHEVMENGEEINPGEVHEDYCDIIGYPNGKQTCLALPWPEDPDRYILFHQPSEIISIPPHGFDIVSMLLYYSVIDKSYNNGQGKVIEKNQIIIEDTLHTGHITAVKHANGRDWWVLVPERTFPRYHTLLVRPEGMLDTFVQELGIPLIKKAEGTGAAAFSPDGTRYMRFSNRDGVHLFNFNRETGLLSDFFHIPGTPDTGAFGGAAFSPSGQYLYVSEFYWTVYQYDLWATDIVASKKIVGEYDGFTINNFWYPDFAELQLGPDCRIYISTTSSNYYVHVINKPDMPAEQCEFLQRAIRLPVWYKGTLPHFPNYRLDSLGSYPCDSSIVFVPHDPTGVWAPAAPAQRLDIYPNPASAFFRISLPAETGGWVGVYNALGREVLRRPTPPGAQWLEVDAAGWPPGLYACRWHSKDGRVLAGWVVVE